MGKSTASGASPSAAQNKSAFQEASLMNITLVDPVRRVAKAVGIGKTAEVWVKLPEGLDHLDLPPSGEGWQAIVKYDSAEPYIVSFMPPNSENLNEETITNSPHDSGSKFYAAESILNSNTQYRSFKANTGKNFRHDRPLDSIPGDKGFWGIDGNLFGVFRGKLNISKVSNSVSWFQSAYHKLTRIVTNKLDLFTSWGTIKIQQDKDLVRMEVQMSDRHSKARVEKYDAFLEIGACRSGNNFFSFTLAHADKMSKPLTVSIDNKGECAYSVPEEFRKHIDKSEIISVTNNSQEDIGLVKQIYADKGIKLFSKAGAGSIQLGPKEHSYAHPNDSLVKKPHLDKYEQLLDWIQVLVTTPNLLGIPGVIFFPAATPETSVALAQKSTVLNDITTEVVAK
jgi:hypothetical protein